MSDTPAQEPTMEEILASIRRIISEDDAPADKAEAPLPIPPPEEPVIHAAPEPEEGVRELTERVDAPTPVESLGDLDVYTPSGPREEEPEPEPTFATPPAPEVEPIFEAPAPLVFDSAPSEGLVGAAAASVAASHFGKLASGLLMPSNGRTLEDVVRELLNPLLKAWLDDNLPAIVEAKVEEEIARVSRGRVS